MNSEIKVHQDVYRGLEELSQTVFPKRCKNCDRVYETAGDYIRQTQPVPKGSGLQEYPAHENTTEPVVHLYRNCVCGSTLVGLFEDRRDTTPQGLQRRKLFEELIKLLIGKGLDRRIARAEIVKVINGQESKVLEQFGIRFQAG